MSWRSRKPAASTGTTSDARSEPQLRERLAQPHPRAASPGRRCAFNYLRAGLRPSICDGHLTSGLCPEPYQRLRSGFRDGQGGPPRGSWGILARRALPVYPGARSRNWSIPLHFARSKNRTRTLLADTHCSRGLRLDCALPETLSKIRTARGLRQTAGDHLPPVQLELFLEAGVNLAAQAARAGAGSPLVEEILRRALGQTESVAGAAAKREGPTVGTNPA